MWGEGKEHMKEAKKRGLTCGWLEKLLLKIIIVISKAMWKYNTV